jgi:serine/threonine protein kinase
MEPKKANDPAELGGWRINGRLGEGGFGTVFLAEKGAQKAAIKVIREEFVAEDDARARLVTEAEILSKLSDPSIGKILDSDLSGELPWIATEFINGPTLDEKVKYEGPLEEIAWFNLAANIFHAIVSANELGIIHKDIKPSNIILGETGDKLIDFGIAHISGQTRSAVFGDREGSTPFSSPEHFTVKPNPKMDVFSTAATLAFAGKASSIWNGDNDLQLMRSINEDEPNLEGLTENQVKFLIPLLEKNPSDRPSALSAHQSALGYIEFLLGRSKKPVPLKGRSKLKRFISSKKMLVMTFAMTSLAILTFAFINSQNTNKNPLGSIDTSQTTFTSPKPNIVNELSSKTESEQKKISSSSAECQLEYERKGQNVAKICLPSATKGDVQSIFYMGQSYFKNQNYKEAEKWFLLGAKKEDLNSMRYLIETYTQVSNTLERDKWTKICADTSYGSSDTSPLKDIAYCKMMQGFILERAGSTKEAILYLTDAAEYGNGDAAAWLGTYYRGRDEKIKALKWLEKAAELGSTTGLNALIGYADEIGDSQLTRKWLLVSANDGNQVNMGVLALTYYFEKDFTSAKKWATKGMSYGDVLSTYVLGASNYDTGQKNEGKSLLLKAGNKGNLPAIRKLGSIYRIEEKNFPEAAIWYEKLAARNDFTGTFFYSVVLFAIGKDEESCTYNDKVLSLGNQAKKDGTYDPEIMDKFMIDAKSTSDNWCSKLYKKS